MGDPFPSLFIVALASGYCVSNVVTPANPVKLMKHGLMQIRSLSGRRSALHENSHVESILNPETLSPDPALYTDPHSLAPHNVHWSQEDTNWCIDALYPHGSPRDEFVYPCFEGQLDTSVVPETWHTFQKNENECFDQHSGVHGSTCFLDPCIISSHLHEPSSKMEAMSQGNICFHSAQSQETYSPYPVIHTNPDKLQDHNADWTQELKNWDSNPPGSASNQLIHPHSAKTLDSLMLPELWHTSDEDGNVWIDQSPGVYGTDLPLDSSKIISHLSFNPTLQDSLQTHQGLYQIHHEDGLMLNQHPSFVQTSQVETMAPQGRQLSTGIQANQADSSALFQNPETSLPILEITHENYLMDYDHERSQCNNLGASETPSSVPGQLEKLIHQDAPLRRRRRTSIGEEFPDQVKTRVTSLDNTRNFRYLRSTTHSGNKKTLNSQGVMSDCTEGSFSCVPVTPNFERSVATGKNQNISSGPDMSKKSFKEFTMPALKEESTIDNHFDNPGQRTLIMLKDIGLFHAANSPIFAYQLTKWFKNLRDEMMKVSGQDKSLAQNIHKAIDYAHWWVTMGVFGIISIHFNNVLDSPFMQKILEHAWQMMKTVFDPWRSIGIENTRPQEIPGGSEFKQGDLLDPQSLFRYFVKVRIPSKMKSHIFKSILQKYNEASRTSQIPIPKSLGQLHNKVKRLYSKDMIFIHGGFYSRASISNLEFEAIKFHNGHKITSWASNLSEKHNYAACRSLSLSAGFLVPEGIELCQRVHHFFVELIIELLKKYKVSNRLHLYSLQQIHLGPTVPPEFKEPEHEYNMETIVKAVSVAEYRITVGFIGMIRSIYKDILKETQMNTLIESGWEFLQKEFSKWKLLSFEDGKNSILFTQIDTPQKNRLLSKSYMDPPKSFQYLCKLSKMIAHAPIPSTYLKILLRSWYTEDAHENLKNTLGDIQKTQRLCKNVTDPFTQ
ncbi:hypothetical protein DFH28DRAFT_1109221 [Melampsora americana]|nr:hypothetical protein DFH28DRAFT_1109221 [Melampsora americana]